MQSSDNVRPLYPGAGDVHHADVFERWLETGTPPQHGPALHILLARARETILTYRSANPHAPA